MFLDKLFSAWALSNLAVSSAVAVEWYAKNDNEEEQLWDQLASPSSFQCCTAALQLQACFQPGLPEIVRQFMSADAEYLAQYDLDYNAWQSACGKKQSYNAWELTVLRYMKWWLLDPGQALADATSSNSGFDKLVADSTDKLKQITELQEAGAWGPKNKVHIHQTSRQSCCTNSQECMALNWNSQRLISGWMGGCGLFSATIVKQTYQRIWFQTKQLVTS